MLILRKFLKRVGLAEDRRGKRAPVRGLEVLYGTGRGQKKARIKDISLTGIFVVTKEHWQPGTEIILTLEKKSYFNKHSSPSVRLWAKVVRLGEDGVGMTFLRNEADAAAWLKRMDTAAALTGREDIIRTFRAAMALAFLSRVSSSMGLQALKSAILSVSPEEQDRFIGIAVQSNELLEQRNCPTRSDVSPQLILQILEGGSKAENSQTQKFWLEMLATSCLIGQQDDESQRLASVLPKLIPMHFAILTYGCDKMVQARFEPGPRLVRTVRCTAEEIRKLTHMRNLVAIERHLNYLHELGLLEKTAKPLNCELLEHANLTPTCFGFELYTRCIRPREQTNGRSHLRSQVAV